MKSLCYSRRQSAAATPGCRFYPCRALPDTFIILSWFAVSESSTDEIPAVFYDIDGAAFYYCDKNPTGFELYFLQRLGWQSHPRSTERCICLKNTVSSRGTFRAEATSSRHHYNFCHWQSSQYGAKWKVDDEAISIYKRKARTPTIKENTMKIKDHSDTPG